jgi:gamma-glutamyl hercynylcysteine S-oxide synthase
MSATAIQLDNREVLLGRLSQARSITDRLFQIVRTNALYDRPIAERHRIVFYIGHLEAFDWNLIADHGVQTESSHKKYDRLFAFGIDPVGGGLPTDQPSDWPQLAEVEAYNQQVRQELNEILADRGTPRHWNFPADTLLQVAIEHRLMHAETLAYMFHQLPIEKKVAPEDYREWGNKIAGNQVQSRLVRIPAGIATLGIRRGQQFGWDNEFQVNTVQVPEFAIDAYKVTNSDFLQFVRAGGYDNESFWTPEDWKWVKDQNITHPGFWSAKGGAWVYRGMFEEIPLPLDSPVYVSHAEAAAYARFVGKELPTEAQFHRAAYGTPEGSERLYPWGDAEPDSTRGNFDFQHWDPVAIGGYPQGRSAFGVEDIVGNGWEWTSSLFEPFSGFEPFPFYRGYSANFFDGKHYVMKGGSPRTAACMLRRSFRNWFQGHYPFVYASFRCITN